MPNQKVILNYRQFGERWSEIYYGGATSVSSMAALFDNAFIASTVAFRHSATYLSSIQVQDLAQPRVGLKKKYPKVAPAPLGDDADVRNASAVWVLRSSDLIFQRRLWLRGLNDDDMTRSPATGTDIPSPRLITGVGNFIFQMNRVGLLIRQLNPITPGIDPNDFYDIISVTVAAGGLITLQTRGTVPLSASKRIIVSLIDQKQFPGLKGPFSVRSVNAPNFVVNYRSSMPIGVYPLAKGRYRVQEYRFANIDLQADAGKSDWLHLGSRDTKSIDDPFGRGAKRAVRLRFQ